MFYNHIHHYCRGYIRQ